MDPVVAANEACCAKANAAYKSPWKLRCPAVVAVSTKMAAASAVVERSVRVTADYPQKR